MFSILKFPAKSSYKQIGTRPTLESQSLYALIKDVFEQVKSGGDQALKDLTLKFDKKALNNISYSQAEIDQQADLVPQALKDAIRLAYANIYTFHESQKLVEKRKKE